MPDELSLAVVGARFDNVKRKGKPKGSRQMEILLCEPGDPVKLVPEPKNPADANAIAGRRIRRDGDTVTCVSNLSAWNAVIASDFQHHPPRLAVGNLICTLR